MSDKKQKLTMEQYLLRSQKIIEYAESIADTNPDKAKEIMIAVLDSHNKIIAKQKKPKQEA